MIKNFKLLVILALFAPGAFAAGEDLLDFTSSLNSFSADFTQTVYDSDSVALHESEGRVELLRPGKFRWTYTNPTKQLIVADGLTLWIYDEDIDQVTMQPQVSTLGSAPIGLLSGQRSLQREFEITELGIDNGLRWYQLEPLTQDTDFNKVFLALDDSGLRAMELQDNFEQATQIRFDNFRKNIDVDLALFNFVPPDGVDVIGEAGQLPAQPSAQQQTDTTTQSNDLAPANIIPTPTATQQEVVAPRDSPDPLLDDLVPLQPASAETTPPQAAEQAESATMTSDAPVRSNRAGDVLQQGNEITLEVIETKPLQ